MMIMGTPMIVRMRKVIWNCFVIGELLGYLFDKLVGLNNLCHYLDSYCFLYISENMIVTGFGEGDLRSEYCFD